MSRKVGSLHRSNSHPANLQTQIPVIPLFAFPLPDSPVINVSSSTNFDTNSEISVFLTISQFNNSDVETPNEFADSKPSPSTDTQTNSSAFAKPPFRPIQINHPPPSLSTPSHDSQVTPTYSPINSERLNKNSPDNIPISEELDNFITLQQQLIYPHTLTIHQLSSTATSSNPPTPTPLSDYTPSLAQPSTSTETSISTIRAHRTFKRKFPNHPFPSKPGTAREHINRPNHTNTAIYLQITLPLFPQYTLKQSDTNTETRHFVDENVLIPTLHWTAHYNFTNPLSFPLHNTTHDNEKTKNDLYRLTTSLPPRQFTYHQKIIKNVHRTPS